MSRQGKKLRHFIIVSLLNMSKLLKERICSNISKELYLLGRQTESHKKCPLCENGGKPTRMCTHPYKEIMCCKREQIPCFKSIFYSEGILITGSYLIKIYDVCKFKYFRLFLEKHHIGHLSKQLRKEK